ncbi:MAG: tetratricopeptide repeat protein [Desulfuromonadales bacterium]|nr:tetratricopeptide repeat protein [Desulfuromonadales bacterium]
MSLRLFDRAPRYALLSLPLLILLVYITTFPGHFFMDDAQIVKANNLIYQLDLKEIFTTDYWGKGQDTGLFRPLTILSFALNRLLLGVDPWGYLLINILLHLSISILLYHFLKQIGLVWECAWLAAAIFAVHPIHAEPVIQLVGRSELLAALFVLLTLVFSRRTGLKAEFTAAAFFLLALLSKESGIVVLALIPLSDYFFAPDLPELIRRRYRFYLALLILAGGWLAYRKFIVHPHSSGELIYSAQYVPLAFVDTGTRMLAAIKLQAVYLFNLLWPFRLQGMYPASTVAPVPPWLSLPGITAVAALLLTTWAMIYGWRRHQIWALLIVFYLISFAPTSNLFFAAGFTMADRVAYTPSLWFLSALAVVIFATLPARSSFKILVMTALVGYFIVAGFVRARHFDSPETLWQRDLQLNARNELSRMFLASELIRQNRLAEAEAELKSAIAVAPNFDEALASYAWLLVQTNRPQEARDLALRAIAAMKTGTSQAKIPLSLALTSLGRPTEALQTLQIVRPTDLNTPRYWEAYGKALEAQGDLLGALTCFQNEVNSSGERSPDVFRRLGRLSLHFGKVAAAVEALRRDVQINPKSGASWNLLGVALVQQGEKGAAEEAFARAVAIDETVREYQANLERIRAGSGQ